MASQATAPADTTMMRIVHDALRRDLRRAQERLGADPPPPRDQQRAIASHLTWMMQFLHAHHRSEEDGLYPFVRRRDPAAAEILDAMEHEHETIASEIAAVESCAAALASNSSSATVSRMVVALDTLEQVLLPHLRHEEDAAMPIVSAAITNAEWQALEREHNIEPKSMVELAHEGHWLIDDAGLDDRATVVNLVPAIPRFLLVHGFARRYRRRKERCWGAQRPTRGVQRHGAVEITTNADIDALWAIVRDVTRVGEWSHECFSAAWLDGASSAAPGARFRGRNRARVFRWGRICEVVAVDRYQFVWRTVPTMLYPDSCEWRIELGSGDDGTTIAQSFDAIRAPRLLLFLYALFIPAHRDRTAALADDLHRLGDLARRSAPGGREVPASVG